ncbi:hypothetical protein EU803_10880 [Loktanella sp. IMCC34160]|uniref:hypothetical protein n=1 Tax=Loktanella sp. IMCC34160 TaxID=2510646 RepID=UPI00101C08E1|nr:hypothetical protein [Loktanella sp. IMCC34160]RYG91581.1 hypothetical protein EU803_10880 [Loktanella sp. IMCC34160]
MTVPPLLILQGVIFALWAGMAFRVLFHLRRRAVDRTGTGFPGPITFVRVTREWLADPDERRWHMALAGLTAALVGVSALFTLTR